MNDQKSKMLIASIVLIRIFVHEMIMKSKETLKVSTNAAKLLNIGSFLYNLAMEIIKSSAPIYSKNQDFLTVDLKIKPRAHLLKALGKKA